MDKSIHRSRQKIPFVNRQHLHDGLRLMTLEIPKLHGWHLPRTATNPLDAITDDFEEKLYRGAYCTKRSILCTRVVQHNKENETKRLLSLQLMKTRIEWANAYSVQKQNYGRSMKGVAVIEILTLINFSKRLVQSLQKSTRIDSRVPSMLLIK